MASKLENVRREHGDRACKSARRSGSHRRADRRLPVGGRPPIVVKYGDPWETDPCTLLPSDAFHAPGESPTDRRSLRKRFGLPEESTKKNSSAVRSRFLSCTAGWPTPPTSREFYLAVREATPSSRQKAVIRAWLAEATYQEIMLAWLEEAFSWRELVAAVHRVGYHHHGLNRYLNQFAKPEVKRVLDCPPQPSI